jgi:phospholipid-translocating ATPase
LYEQFRGIANFYFLSLVILQAFDQFKTVSIGLTAAPIILIVMATGVKVILFLLEASRTQDNLHF